MNSAYSTPKLIALGVLAGLLFSTTFVVNRFLGLQGGHWYWTAALRYFWVLLVLLVWSARKGRLQEISLTFASHPLFWIGSGTLAVGVFYSGLCFSATYLPAWVTATTWQLTILATPWVLRSSGKPVPARSIALGGLVFFGIVLVNLDQLMRDSTFQMLAGSLPIVVSSIAYPWGNQLVWEAARPSDIHPESDSGSGLRLVTNRILLMILGSIPFWIVLGLLVRPDPPTSSQLISTSIVALFSGILATGVFYFARQKCQTPHQLAAVDTTQASEILFAMAGEAIFLSAPLPTPLAGIGLAVVILGQLLFLVPEKT
jgi:drug/metabolite transporter (DMT)-like permease